jgi:hypothetical protein
MPRVSPLNSQVAFRSQVSDTFCNIANSSEGFHGPCLGLVSSPVRTRSLSRLSASFLFWLTSLSLDRLSPPTVLIHSSNLLPSGNCDSLRIETLLSYFIRFGQASSIYPHRFSPFFAFTDDARTSPEELVNSASATQPFSRAFEGLSQPA